MNKKILSQGIAKVMRKRILTDESYRHVDKKLLLRMFMDELSERDSIKTGVSKLKCSDYLWYISYEGRLAMVKKGGMKSNAERLLHDKWIKKDSDGIYRGTRVINGRGCQHPKHRPIVDGLSNGRWNPIIVERLNDMLEGGHELEMTIDRNFHDAYEPNYDINTYIDDAVCGYSCMSERPDEAEAFYGNIEGCYVARFLKDGENIGRCIMYTDGKIRHFIRIYCHEDFMRDCLFTLKKNMTPDDIFGRNQCIEGLELPADFTANTPNMYLDGNKYGLKLRDGKFYVGTDYDWDCKETSDGSIIDTWDELRVCHNCGCLFASEHEGIMDSDTYEWYCCADCAYESDVYQCDGCGEWASDIIITLDDNRYCSARCARAAGYVKTDYDGDWILEEDALCIADSWYYKDEYEAAQGGWHRCADCGEWTRTTEKCTDGGYRCAPCLSKNGWTLAYVKTNEVKDEKTGTAEASAD